MTNVLVADTEILIFSARASSSSPNAASVACDASRRMHD